MKRQTDRRSEATRNVFITYQLKKKKKTNHYLILLNFSVFDEQENENLSITHGLSPQ
jgi:hypothetical protein